MVKVEEELGIVKIDDSTYESVQPLKKPGEYARGVYGGNLVGQALLVAIKSSPPGFRPHSIHSHFTKATTEEEKLVWKVDVISNGKTFVNRHVKALQFGKVTYIANVSLTKKNSFKELMKAYQEWEVRQKEREEKLANGGEEDDDDDEPPLAKPTSFGRPFPSWLAKHTPESIEGQESMGGPHIVHKITPEMSDLKVTEDEEHVPVSERQLAYYVKWGNGEEEFEVPEFDIYKYVGAGVLSDSWFLSRMGRVFRLKSLDHTQKVHYYAVSLDHVMYFHDEDFDPTKWMGFAFNAIRYVNNRVLFEAEMFNDKGKHIVSVIQEGMVHFNGLDNLAKL